MGQLYICRLFPSYRHEIFILGVQGFSKTTGTYLKIHYDVQKLSKMSKVFRNLHTIVEVETQALTFPGPSLRTYIAKHDLAPSAFYLKKEISSFIHSSYFLHQFHFTYFFKLCEAKL